MKRIFIFLTISLIFIFNLYPQEKLAKLSSKEETSQREEPKLGMEGKISLDLRDIDVVEALKFLAMKAGINIVTTKGVSGRVSLRVENAPVKDVFDVMLRANGLAYQRIAGIYNVMTETEYKNLYGKYFSDVRKVKIFHLAYAIPEQIFNLCDTLKSDVGRILVSPESGTVVIMDTEEKIKLVEEAIKSFEKKNVVKVFNLNYAKAKDVAEQLKSQLEAKKVGFVRADERTNQVIVQTLPERMNQIEDLIRKLDKRTPEVLIEAKIVKVKLNESTTEEVEWEGLFDVASQKYGLRYLGSTPFTAVQAEADPWRSRLTVLEGGKAPDGTDIEGVKYVGGYPFSGTSTNYSAGNRSVGSEEIHLGIVDKNADFDVILKFFNTLGKTQVVSTPKITVVNNQEARLHIGERQAYVTSTTTTGQTTSTVSEEVTFVDVGTQLFLTPTINEEGYITLKLKAEVSSVVETLVTPTNNKIPIIGTSLAETTVLTKSGTTIVIGGLRSIDKGRTRKSTPILGNIPIIGKLFSSDVPTKSRDELLVMITPTIITGDVLVDKRGQPVGKTLEKPLKSYYPEGLRLKTQEPEKKIKLKKFKSERQAYE
ncbi:MAG TPA: hypothetical protein ENI31_06700 [Candidatus Omnitrophica bacterium]|nr:MAG: hypothetical protein DRP69_02445 [Candidatus Omnitrophota bacterium]RKY43822.1 MAG: hypothetical protein DRP80_04210 [Candidatus Omnitrophota bacterium]HEC69951.1 hypothetical protein [Candidatus Omnitrophota bacterium]